MSYIQYSFDAPGQNVSQNNPLTKLLAGTHYGQNDERTQHVLRIGSCDKRVSVSESPCYLAFNIGLENIWLFNIVALSGTSIAGAIVATRPSSAKAQ